LSQYSQGLETKRQLTHYRSNAEIDQHTITKGRSEVDALHDEVAELEKEVSLYKSFFQSEQKEFERLRT
jgi:hypothetical protein